MTSQGTSVQRALLAHLYVEGTIYPCRVYGYIFRNPLFNSVTGRDYILSTDTIYALEGRGLIVVKGNWREMDFSISLTSLGEQYMQKTYTPTTLNFLQEISIGITFEDDLRYIEWRNARGGQVSGWCDISTT